MADQGPARALVAASPDTDAVARAMNEVIAAERAALAAVDACRAAGARQVNAARLEARRIVDRAERIAQAIHARTERVAEARARAVALAAAQRPAPPEALDSAVERVASWLAGDRDGDGDD
jgi:regulator of protease activity HflC (stomatin/prohibitin superfamily)